MISLHVEQKVKLIQLNIKSFGRLREYNRYYYNYDYNVSSFDAIIGKLIDFQEKQNIVAIEETDGTVN